MKEVVTEIKDDIEKNVNFFFNFFRNIDYRFQGKRTKIFINGAFIIVLIAPLIDYAILPQRMSVTPNLTYLYLFFFILSTIAWTGRFRDDDNKWSFKRVKSKLSLSRELAKLTFEEVKKKDLNSKVFTFGFGIFILGFIIKAFQNISEIFRIPLQNLGFRMKIWKTFESWTGLGFFLIAAGLTLLLILHFSGKIDIIKALTAKGEKPHNIKLDLLNNHVINLKNNSQVEELIAANPDIIFQKTLINLLKWKPVFRTKEADYQDDLRNFLSLKLIKYNLKVEDEHNIESGKEKGRVDLVINKSLFIELKHKMKGTDFDRAKGQVFKYQDILQQNNTPVILLIVDNNFEKIKDKLISFTKEFNKKNQKLLVLVTEPMTDAERLEKAKQEVAEKLSVLES